MSEIRVGYTGLIAFAVSIISIFTALIFTVLLTRGLSTNDFGLWHLILGFIGYGIIIESTISFWTTREIARGKEVGKTSVISSMLFSTIAIIIYLVAVYFTGNLENVNQEIILMGVILVPTVFIKTTLYALNIGWKPQISSYSLLLGEIIKIPFVIYFLYFLEMGVFGVIIGVTISNLASILFLLYFGRKKIQVKFSIIILKKWIKYSWYPLYAEGISNIKTFDVLIFVLFVE